MHFPSVCYSLLIKAFIQIARADDFGDLSSEACCANAQDATVWSLVYGIPLIAFANQTTKVFAAVGGANKINTQTQLASLASAAVVKPNVDTVYSRVIVDLSKDDLVLTVPEIKDRFWIFPFYDVFGNNFASLSPVTDSPAGDYLIRRSDDALVQPGAEILTKPDPAYGSKYQGVINYPTTYGTILIRILVKQNTTENLDIVHRYQSQYNIKTTPRLVKQPSSPAVPTITKVLNNATTNITGPSEVLSFLARIASYNQPEVLSTRYRVASILGSAGLVSGQYSKPALVDLDKAYADAQERYLRVTSKPSNVNFVGNGWQLSIPPLEGNFTTKYSPRALVAQTGYQQLVPNIVLYPGWKTSSFGEYSLAPNESFLFTFSGKPPIQGSSSLYPTKGVSADQAGFWSLTVYGADRYLVNSTIQRFEVGDRTESLAYDDGTKVYRPANETAHADAPFKVLMQRADVAPPKNWTGNWLPSPAGGGDLSFIMRFYRPFEALTNGSYVYPTVERVSLIKG